MQEYMNPFDCGINMKIKNYVMGKYVNWIIDNHSKLLTYQGEIKIAQLSKMIDDKIVAHWAIKAAKTITKAEIIQKFDTCGWVTEEGRKKSIETRLPEFLREIDHINNDIYKSDFTLKDERFNNNNIINENNSLPFFSI